LAPASAIRALAFAVLLALSAGALAGCEAGYIAHAAYEETCLLWRRKPIDTVLARGDLQPAVRAKPETVLKVREFAGDRPHHLGNPLGVATLRVAAAAQLRLYRRLQHLDHVLDEAVQLLCRPAVRLGDRRARVEHPYGQRLRTALAVRHPELDALAGLERLDTGGQRRLADVDVLTAVLGQEAEALVRIVPLDPAARHRSHPSLVRTRPASPEDSPARRTRPGEHPGRVRPA